MIWEIHPFYISCMDGLTDLLHYSAASSNVQYGHHLFRPCLLPDVLMYTLSTDEKKKALLAEQGAADWETFLLHRCRELLPGKRQAIPV